MTRPSSKVRKTFFGLWIAMAAVLLMAGRAGGSVGAMDATRLAPVAAETLLPSNVVRAGDFGSTVAD